MHTCVGVDFKHPDLVRNYVRKPIRSSQLTEYVDPCIVVPYVQLLGLDLNALTCTDSAFPNFGDTHGTYVAGVIGMEKSNSVCGVGVAYNSLITGGKFQQSLSYDQLTP